MVKGTIREWNGELLIPVLFSNGVEGNLPENLMGAVWMCKQPDLLDNERYNLAIKHKAHALRAMSVDFDFDEPKNYGQTVTKIREVLAVMDEVRAIVIDWDTERTVKYQAYDRIANILSNFTADMDIINDLWANSAGELNGHVQWVICLLEDNLLTPYEEQRLRGEMNDWLNCDICVYLE
jgi:hypothetical protein